MSEQEKVVTPDGKVIKEVIPMKGMRKIIADRMKQSKVKAPHAYGFVHMDVTPMVELKNKLAAEGKKISYTEILAKVCALALAENPMINASYDEKTNEIQVYESINIGIAVATPSGGLIVPVIKNCESKSLFEISEAQKDIVNRVKTNKMSMDMLTGGTFTITSMGMFGMDGASPIINMPEAMILAFGAIKKMPAYDANDNIVPRYFCYISTAMDHCVLDGVPAAKFTQRISQIIDEIDKYLLA
jgi:pyruvate/2-oxoglutarate dehydrogenase complex dihydrolipoamide acyltransferase (E2) component